MITGIYVFLMGVIGLLLGITIERQRNRNIIVGTPSASHNNSKEKTLNEVIDFIVVHEKKIKQNFDIIANSFDIG